jgi:uncharacterized membrane protein
MHKEDWISEGWYVAHANMSFKYALPKFFKGKVVYWYAKDEFGNEWSGSKDYFYVSNGTKYNFEVRNGKSKEKNGGRLIRKGFHKLWLNSENTYQTLVN